MDEPRKIVSADVWETYWQELLRKGDPEALEEFEDCEIEDFEPETDVEEAEEEPCAACDGHCENGFPCHRYEGYSA